MATKIDKARRFANDFVFKHDLGLSEEGAELFAKAILAFEKAAQQGVQADVCQTCGTNFIPVGKVEPWEFCPVCGTRR